jgi:limonene-1,2-epoxide hydrolase
MTADPESVVRQFFDELGKPGQILAACEAHLADDCVWENTGLPTAAGKSTIMAMMGQFVNGYGMDRLVVDLRAIAVSGNAVLTERVDHMDDKDGQRMLSFPLAGTLEVRNGKITRWSDYFDPRPLLPTGD